MQKYFGVFINVTAQMTTIFAEVSEIILGMGSANVTSSLIRWVHTQNDHWAFI